MRASVLQLLLRLRTGLIFDIKNVSQPCSHFKDALKSLLTFANYHYYYNCYTYHTIIIIEHTKTSADCRLADDDCNENAISQSMAETCRVYNSVSHSVEHKHNENMAKLLCGFFSWFIMSDSSKLQNDEAASSKLIIKNVQYFNNWKQVWVEAKVEVKFMQLFYFHHI